ncbi:MAG: NAD(+) synthase [Cyclobacteriaceae bacterium]|nr:NAD(+) synthase [Cyclobacteriaceae bacterium]MCX7636833.1 NAD(+) synthase [Cyclobacteriaceae bacterium]MDW8332205.1 NAD(+) synthase [Cyclobacteriaceae bacterium]
MHTQRIRIAGATVNQTPLDWAGNMENIENAIAEARRLGADLVVLPELCITGYGCEDWFLSDWLSEKALLKLAEVIPHSAGMTVCVGLPLRMNGDTYNGTAVIHNGKLLGITLKQNLARDGVHYEPRWFRAWKKGVISSVPFAGSSVQVGDLIYEINGIRLGIEICEDAWIKNRPAISLQQRGVDIIVNPSASHFALGKSLSREQLVIQSSERFNCVYVYVNLLGNEAGRMIYDGDILIAQRGKLLAQNHRLSFNPVNVLCCEVNLEDVSRSESLPLTDNKERNEELTRALTLGLFDYLRKSRSRGFVLSLSGGADSATCAVMVAEMVKRVAASRGVEPFRQILKKPDIQSPQEVMPLIMACAYQATRNSSTETEQAARTLAQSLGATFYSWSVQPEVDSYTEKIQQAINFNLNWNENDIALQNIQARARSPVIWMLANLRDSILLTTSNRSEGDVGYTTMDGDTSGSLAPVSGLDKPTILNWLKWAEMHQGYTGLQFVNRLKPTAELRPPDRYQTDEDDLMPYTVMRDIEEQAIFLKKSPAETFLALHSTHSDKARLKAHIRKFFRLWAANQWKRERLAPSFHLDDWNVDPRTWCRFPILSSGFEEELKELDRVS